MRKTKRHSEPQHLVSRTKIGSHYCRPLCTRNCRGRTKVKHSPGESQAGHSLVKEPRWKTGCEAQESRQGEGSVCSNVQYGASQLPVEFTNMCNARPRPWSF